ncbi:MAG: hypothetical protein V1494_00580 [Candidatus Diapherotrites archaeon]
MLQAIGYKKAERCCARCGNGSGAGTKKYWFYLHKGQMRKRLCLPCIELLGGSQIALAWLEETYPTLNDNRILRMKPQAGETNG